MIDTRITEEAGLRPWAYIDDDSQIAPRYRWRDVDGNVDRFNAALEEWVRRGEEKHDREGIREHGL